MTEETNETLFPEITLFMPMSVRGRVLEAAEKQKCIKKIKKTQTDTQKVIDQINENIKKNTNDIKSNLVQQQLISREKYITTQKELNNKKLLFFQFQMKKYLFERKILFFDRKVLTNNFELLNIVEEMLNNNKYVSQINKFFVDPISLIRDDSFQQPRVALMRVC